MVLSGPPWARRWPVVAALFATFLLGLLSVHFTPPHSEVAGWWPAAGVSVALIAVRPRREWPLLAAGLFVFTGAANLVGGRDLFLVAGYALTNVVEAVIGGLMLKAGRDRAEPLGAVTDFFRLIYAAVLGSLAAALTVWATVSSFGLLSGSDQLHLAYLGARSVLLSHASATMVIVPLALCMAGRSRVHTPESTEPPRGSPAERVLLMTTLMLMCLLVFGTRYDYPVSFLILPLLVWAALRLPLSFTYVQVLVVGLAAMLSTAQGRGPFGTLIVADQVPALQALTISQLFVVVVTILALPLALEVGHIEQLLTRVASSELLFRRNFTQSLAGMLMLEARGDRLVVVDANDAARALLGDSASEPLIGRFLDRLFAPGHRLRTATTGLLLGTHENWQAAVALAERPDSAVQVSINSVARHPVPVYSAQLTDLTAERQSQALIEAAERLTTATLNTTNAIILLVDRDGVILRANSGATRITGWSEQELVGSVVWERLARPAFHHEWRADFSAAGLGDFPRQKEGSVLTPRGDTVRVTWSNDLVRDEHGRTRYVVLTGQDVTAERRAAGTMSYLLNAEISTCIIGTNREGRITLTNAAARSLLGHPDLVGRPLVDILDLDQVQERGSALGADADPFAMVVDQLQGPVPTADDWTWVAASGQRYTMSVTMSGGHDSEDLQGGWLFIARDVTEQRMGQVLLLTALEVEQQAVERLKALDEAKDDFVSTVSHELRTPVTSIVGYTELLLEDQQPPATAKVLETIARNGDRLTRLCNDLLAMQALGASELHPGHEPIDVGDMLTHVELALGSWVRERDLELVFEEETPGLKVLGDREQLERVLTNLVSNAVKFSPDGGRITVCAQGTVTEVTIRVADTGIGIPAEDQKHLFQRFYRSSNVQNLQIQGTGLGLSIVSSIVAAHGGRVEVDSTVGVGSTFTVRLPAA